VALNSEFMKIIKALLIITGITIILVVVSIKSFPEWLAIPGGLLMLSGFVIKTYVGQIDCCETRQ
jgi:hypothetical protein